MKVEPETITIDNEEQEEKGKAKRYRIPHQCEQCGKSYAVKKALQDHIDFTHRGIRKYECQECKKCFELSTSYRKHLLSHDPTLMFQCETCGHISKSKQYYEIHKRKHTGEKPYVCEQCPAKFADLSSLIAHRKMHSGEAKVMCTLCGKQISKKNNLKRHMAQMHSGRVKPVDPRDQYKLQCQLCDGRFSKLSNLNRHMKQKHSDPPAEAPVKKAPEPKTNTNSGENFIPPNFHNFNSFLFPQHEQYPLPNEMGHHEEIKPAPASQNSNYHMEETGDHKTDTSNQLPDYHDALDNSDINHQDDDSNEKLDASAGDESANRSSTEDKKEYIAKSMEEEEEQIYAGDFLKEDEIKEEIKEEIDSDDLTDENFDSDEYDYENPEEEEEEVENIVRKNEVKEEDALKNSIKEEVEDSYIEANKTSSDTPGIGQKEKKKRIRKLVPPSINACQFCGKIFRFRNSMYRHERKHTGIRYHCEICGESYQNKNYLKHHKCKPGPGPGRRRKEGEPREKQTFTCHVCGNIYQNNESLKNHINIIHHGQRNFPCDICGKLFTRDRTMKTHRKNIHNDIKQFNCIYCNSAYGEKRNLMNHIKRNHPGSELLFRRITPQGEAIMDDKTSLSQVSLNQPTRSKDSVPFDLNNEQKKDLSHVPSSEQDSGF